MFGLRPTTHFGMNMAARQIPRRVLSLFASGHLSPSQTRAAEPILQAPPYTSAFQNIELWRRRFQTKAEAKNLNIKPECGVECKSVGVKQDSSSNVKPDVGAVEAVENPVNNEKSILKKTLTASNLRISERHDTAMMFTCKVCETRSLKMISRESYDKGVVVARCGGCNNMHLIADRLGWFGDPSSVEDFLAERGEEVKKGSADTINLTLEDLAGKKNLELGNI